MSLSAARGLAGRLPGTARLLSCANGATAVEFALVFPLLIGSLLAGLALGVVLLARAQLDEAAITGGRAVQTGSATTSAQVQSAICGAIGGLLTCSNVIFNLNTYTSLSAINTSTPTLTYNGSGALTNTSTTSFGSPRSIMVLQIMYQFPVIGGPLFNFATQSNGSILLTSTQVFVQE
jgi:Flp pilus assembly protein TadG